MTTYNDLGRSLEYISGGVTYLINGTDTTTGLTFRYLGDQGFGLAPLHRITTRGPLQQGDSDIDFRLDPRVLQLPLVVVNTSTTAPRWEHYAIRNAMLHIFRPQTPAILRSRVNASSGTIAFVNERNIAVRVLGGLSFDVDPNSWHVRTVVQLRADDPTWYQGAEVTGNRFSVTYQNANVNGSQVLGNAGNWPSFPIIRLNGPITNPVITNGTAGQAITITATIGAGAFYDINLEYGNKTVVDNLGANQISKVTPASNLATWSLLPGNNTVSITGTGTTGATNAVFQYYHRYTGI